MSASSSRKTVVIVGMGDTGLLTALYLSKHYEIIAIGTKPCLVSGQELGTRLTRTDQWKRKYLIDFEQYRHFYGVRFLHGRMQALDTREKCVTAEGIDGSQHRIHYDALVIATGVSNGFWRTATVQSRHEVEAGLASAATELGDVSTVAIVGGGPTGVSVASNLKEQRPDCAVHLFYSQTRPLPGYHPRTRKAVTKRLMKQGVVLHPEHRAIMPTDASSHPFFTTAPILWQTAQAPFKADKVLWATGATRPNNQGIPSGMLDESGFVRTDPCLRVPDHDGVFAIGDIAATDPLRCSARNAGFLVVAHNVEKYLAGRPDDMKTFKPARHRWGSIFGIQNDGMRIFTPNGIVVRVSRVLVEKLLFPVFVDKMIYRGINKNNV